MKKLVSALCAAAMYFGLVAIIQAEKPCPSDLWEIIHGECYLDGFISSSHKPINDMDGFEVPLLASWSPVELKRPKPPTLQAAYQKKIVKPSEIKLRVSMTLYDDLSLPPMTETVSVLTEGDTDGTQERNGQQEKQALFPAESKNKTFTYYPKSALTIYSGPYDALHDVISYLDKNPSARVDIRAYTDSSSNIARNLVLSRKRVIDIRNYLILHDISDENITVEVLGATNLLKSNQTEGIRPLNHRVEITIR